MIANKTQIEPKRDTSFEPVNGKERKNIAALVRSGTVEELEDYLNIMLELRYCRGQRDGLEQGKQSGMDALDSVFAKDTLPDRVGSALAKLNGVLSGDLRAADAATRHEKAPKPSITAPEDVVDCRDNHYPHTEIEGGFPNPDRREA